MSELFPLDANANDALIESEQARREALIEKAVNRFAPRLRDDPNVEVIHLHSSNASLRQYIRENFSGSKSIVVEHCFAGKKTKHGVNEVTYDGMILPLPKEADLVVTKSALSTRVEWLAARLKAMPVVLPEGEAYVRARLRKQGVLVIVGGEQAKSCSQL